MTTLASLSLGEDIIIDNGDSRTSYTGTWDVSTAPNPYGSTSLWGNNNATYTWTFTPATSGTYELSMWWTSVSTRRNNVPVTIQYTGGNANATVNQQVNGGQWNVIGQYTFNAGTAYNVTITSAAASPPSTCADAVKFTSITASNNPPTAQIISILPNPANTGQNVTFSGSGTDSDGTITAYSWDSSIDGHLSDTNTFSDSGLSAGTHTISFKVQDDDGVWSTPVEQTFVINASVETIIDNGDASTSSTGTWQASTAAGAYGSNSVWSHSGATYTWTFTPIQSGYYKVSMWWTALTSRSTSVPVFIENENGNSIADLNQTQNGGQWNVVEEGCHFYTGKSYNVTITAPTGSPPSTCADAVKFTLITALNTPPIATIDSISPNPANVGETVHFVGHGTDIDGTIIAYHWDSDIDATLSNNNSFSTSGLSPGSHVITFIVRDDANNNEWSDPAQQVLVIQAAGNNPPTASITSITPSTSTVGQSVSFVGTGSDSDGTIAAYKWESNIDGVLSSLSSFTTTTLSAGSHTISFSVQDDDGAWSTPVTQSITVETSSTETIIDNGDSRTSSTGTWQASTAAGAYGSNSLWSHSGATYTWTFTPATSGTYTLSMWWTALSSRSASVPVTIQYNGGTGNSTLNQQQNGGQWNEVGQYSMLAGTAYNVTITAPAGSPPSTCADAVKFTYTGSVNIPPTATITSILPSPAIQGQTVTFDGSASDSDGTISEVKWESNIDGVIGNQLSFTKNNLSIGSHTITFSAKDNQGLWSGQATQTIVIQPIPNVRPTASITSITPAESTLGQVVSFVGAGNDTDGTVTAYKWQSDIDGNLSDLSSFTTTALSAGNHIISFSVQDNDGEWSTVVTQTISVVNTTAETIIDNGDTRTSSTGTWQTSAAAGAYGTNSLWSYNGATYTWSFTPTATGYYSVSMWWAATSSRSTSVPVNIAGTTATINQTQNGGQWNQVLASALYNAGTTYNVTITAPAGSPPSTCADAVKFTWLGTVINNLPVATINSITPNPASTGESVTFVGSGTDSDGTVAAYSWTSSIDGVLSNASTFSTSSLSIGTHTIIFEVQDDDGEWSTEVLQTLNVGNPATETIIDNGDANTSYTGTWTASTAAGSYVTASVYGSSNATYTWTFKPKVSGSYTLAMWWTAISTRSSSVPVSIENNGSTATSTINQQQNGGKWNEIGQYNFNAGTEYDVTITAGATSPPSTCADAVKFTLAAANNTPVATIDSITPNPANQGQNVQFKGHGSDADGTIQAYRWTSSLDGIISDANWFTTNTLSLGTHTITFEVRDNGGLWSEPMTTTVTINEIPNVPPTASITSITPNPATLGQTVSFVGSGTDTDGTIAAYKWQSSIDGNLSNEISFTKNNLSIGTHTITLTVQDNKGAWSTAVTRSVVIQQITNNPPTAAITSITPNPVTQGQSVAFAGTGTDSDGTISAYRWTSSINGVISTSASFNTSLLSAGTHTISFKVQDDDGAWSATVTRSLTVNSSMVYFVSDNGSSGTTSTGTWIASGAANPYGTNSIYAYSGSTYTWSFKPTVSGNYQVYLWWTELSTRNTAVPYAIQRNGGTTTVTVNQTTNGGKWNSAGTFAFTANQTYTAKVTSSSSTYNACADAVAWVLATSSTTPTAQITSVSPSSATMGQSVEFCGAGFDGDGTISAYEWKSNINGTIGSSSNFTTSSLSAGIHTISLRVQDNSGNWSPTITQQLVVSTSGNNPPTASITSISPNPESAGQTVSFSGMGTDNDGTIAAYNWQSSIDGALSTQSSFTKNNLSAGTHTISFKVQDNTGNWSPTVTQTLTVGNPSIEVIIDNGGSGTTSTGTWAASTASGAYGTNSLYAVTNAATYSWAFTPTTTGTYSVSMWWTAISSRVTNAPVSITNAGTTANLTVNQTTNGGKWNELGQYTFNAGTTYRVTITAPNVTPPSTCADAVKFTLGGVNPPTSSITAITPNPATTGQSISFSGTGTGSGSTITAYNWQSSIDGVLSTESSFMKNNLSFGTHTISFKVQDNLGTWSAPATQSLVVNLADIIIDNGSANTSYTGTWYSSTSASGYYGTDYLWGENSSTFTFKVTPKTTGNYAVFAWWTQYETRNTNATYTIVNAGGSSNVTVNQQQNGGKWNSLGMFPFQANITYNITITAAAGESLSTCADAIKLVYDGPVTIALPPVAQILTVTPNPGMPNQTIVFKGKAIDGDGTVVAYNWRSSIDGALGTTSTLNKTLTAGTHTIYFKAQDNTGLWSSEVSATVDVGREYIYIAQCYGGNEVGQLSMTSVLQSLGATQTGTYDWTYTNPTSGKVFYIKFVRNGIDLVNAMKRDGTHIIVSSHSNYGLGYIFSTAKEDVDLMLNDIKYVDDNRIVKFGTAMCGVSAYGMRTGQAYPYWWPIYRDGTSAIAPYDFNDPNGPPAYNYYLTYQAPGDPNYYKVQTVNNAAIQRFSDSSMPPWYSIDGRAPDANNPNEKQYFIRNTEKWYPSIASAGTWTQYQDLPANRVNSQYFKENYVYNAAGTGSDYMRYLFTIPTAGQYKVQAWWPAMSTNATNVPYTVYYFGGSSLITVDQTKNGRKWNDLGTFTFNPGDYSVLETDAASSGYVIADAIRVGHTSNPNDVVQSDFVAVSSSFPAKIIPCGPAPLNVMFVNAGTGDLTERLWDCGDGYTNTTRDMLYHEYINPGVYTISLTVRGPLGSSTKTKTGYVIVWPADTNQTLPLTAEFACMNKFNSISKYNAPLAASFADVSRGANITSWLWNFGDNQTSTEQNPLHIYAQPGNYNVSLTVTNGAGQTATETKPNYLRVVQFEKTIDNVDYPKTSYGGWVGKTMLKTKTADVIRSDMRYSRMLLESCNSGDYYIQSVGHGKMYYSVGSSTGQGSLAYLRNYLLEKNDKEVWDSMQQVQAVYDFYNFNLLPNQQDTGTLAAMTTSEASAGPLTSEEQSAIEGMKSMSAFDVFETLSQPEYMTNDKLSGSAISQAYSGREYDAIEIALMRVKTPIESTDNNCIQELKTAKSIFKQYSNIAIPRITSLYPQEDPAVNANLITASGVLVNNNEIKAMLIDALDDLTFTTDDNPELVGRPLRVCDIAYNQLVLNLNIQGVLRTIGTGMTEETRDYHINVLKGKL
jgi:PKD repeat protein